MFHPFFRCQRLVAGLALTASLLTADCAAAAPMLGYKVVATYPHSTESYTEGFFYLDGLFYEGTGLKGNSAVLVEQPETGKILQRRELSGEYFGEGIIDWG